MSFDFSAYLYGRLDNPRRSSGAEVVADCPWCSKSGHLYANTETGAFICFKCNDENPSKGKTIYGLIAKLEGLSIAQAKAMVFRQVFKFERRRSAEAEPAKLSERLRSIKGVEAFAEKSEPINIPPPKEMIPVWDGKKWRVPKYMTGRGFTREAMATFRMGFANRGGILRGRIVMPFECPNGRSFTARATRTDQEPRYYNPPDSGAGRLLYGWEQSAREDSELVIVEGPLDAVRLWQNGIGAVALLGKALKDEQLLLIARLRLTGVTVMLDPEEDEAPIAIARRLIPLVARVWIAHLPDGVDPGASTKEQAWAALRDAEPYTGDRGARARRMLAKVAKGRGR